MSFRTKLLCVVAVPVIGLIAVGGLSATDSISADAIAVTSAATALLSIALVLTLARRVARPLQELTEAAGLLATERLPALIDGIAAPGNEDNRFLAATIQPIEIHSHDEIGQLASAFNSIQTVAVDVAAEQAALMRKGIGDLFVNLARRNQVLLDRQIEVFDELEADEQDADQLAKLYRLDHIATRMRRNAESLLVLAGVESTRRRTKHVAMLDVVRAAIGEIEDYTRVDVGHFDELQLQGTASVDLGHLLAELLENATQLSPPETRVIVEGRAVKHGYALSLTDSGVGMTPEQVAEANHLLANPPPVGLAISRTLGLTVVARLASRHNVTVRLAAVPGGGTVVVVSVPSHLVVAATVNDDPADAREQQPAPVLRDQQAAHPSADPAAGLAAGPGQLDEADFDELVRSAWADEPADATEEGFVEPEGEPEPLPQRLPRHMAVQDPPPANLSDALPQGKALEVGLDMLARGDDRLGPPTLVEPEIPEPGTTGGLARRIRRSTPPPAAPADAEPSILASNRSPDEVRSMLARYRDGMQHGQAGDLPPEAVDGADG